MTKKQLSTMWRAIWFDRLLNCCKWLRIHQSVAFHWYSLTTFILLEFRPINLGSCTCTPQTSDYRLFKLFFDQSIVADNPVWFKFTAQSRILSFLLKGYTLTSTAITCQNVSMFCALGEDNSFYQPIANSSRGIAYIHPSCDNTTKSEKFRIISAKNLIKKKRYKKMK